MAHTVRTAAPRLDDRSLVAAGRGRTPSHTAATEMAKVTALNTRSRAGPVTSAAWNAFRLEAGRERTGPGVNLGTHDAAAAGCRRGRILVTATDAGMANRINALIKRRELFRPLAPAVLAGHASDYFGIHPVGRSVYPFMLAIAPVKPGKRKLLPAVVHVDGTARVQPSSARPIRAVVGD